MSAPTKKDVLSRLPSKVQENVEVLTPGEAKQSVAYHISDKNDIRKFVPFVSRRTVENEDRSVARISVSMDLVDCISGHAATDRMHLDDVEFNGLWTIYSIPFDYVVKPKTKVLPDVRTTDERWLLTYSKDTEEYKGDRIGEFFYVSITYEQIRNVMFSVLAVRITDDSGLHLCPGQFLHKGYYKVRGTSMRSDKTKTRIRGPMEISSVEEISKEEYQNLQNKNTVMESFGPKITLHW